MDSTQTLAAQELALLIDFNGPRSDERVFQRVLANALGQVPGFAAAVGLPPGAYSLDPRQDYPAITLEDQDGYRAGVQVKLHSNVYYSRHFTQMRLDVYAEKALPMTLLLLVVADDHLAKLQLMIASEGVKHIDRWEVCLTSQLRWALPPVPPLEPEVTALLLQLARVS
ncbi:MAG TPA: hypothetical protein VIJ18_07375 [Microbacteriaceae bacterium]